MKAKNKETHAVIRRIPLEVIERAKESSFEDMETILHFYRGYMLKFCRFTLYDASGNAYTCFDDEMFHELQSKLMDVILKKFEVR